MLLARIKANYSSSDISSDEEVQEKESQSLFDQEVREDIEDGGTRESGKWSFVLVLLSSSSAKLQMINAWIHFKSESRNQFCLQKENLTNDVSATGEDLASETSDSMPEKPKSRHHLLQLKLTLDEGTSGSNEVEQQSKRRAEKNPACKHIFDLKQKSCSWWEMTSSTLMDALLFPPVKLKLKVMLTATVVMTMRAWVRSLAYQRMVKTNLIGTSSF